MKLLFRKRPFIVLLVVVTCILFIFFLLFFQNTLKIGLLFDLDTVQTLENKYTIYDYVKKHPVISGKKVVLITEHAHLTKVPLQEVYQKLVKKKSQSNFGKCSSAICRNSIKRSQRKQNTDFSYQFCR